MVITHLRATVLCTVLQKSQNTIVCAKMSMAEAKAAIHTTIMAMIFQSTVEAAK